MKKILYLLISVLLLGGIGYSCTDDFEKTNENPNKLYNTQPEYVFPGIVYKSMENYAKMNYRLYSYLARYVVIWAEQKDTEDMSQYFEGFYVKSLKDLKLLEDEYVGKEGLENISSILMTWKAYTYYIMVSSFGGVPMSEANTERGHYKYDTEEEVYTEILRLLDNAVEKFNVNGDKLSRDPLFRAGDGSSDIARWRKFANTLRLNVALTIQNMNPTLAEENIRKALTNGNESYLISSVNDAAKFKCGVDLNNDASFYYRDFLRQYEAGTVSGTGTYPAMSHNFFLYMKSYNDPRLPKFAAVAEGSEMATINNDTLTRINPKNPSWRDSIIVSYRLPFVPRKDFKEVPAGWNVLSDPRSPTGEQYRSPYSDISILKNECFVSREYLKIDAEIMLLSWAETCFMKAEVAVKYPGILSGTAQQYYEEGIKASMSQYGVTNANVDAYLKQDGVKWDTDGEGVWEYRHFYKADIKGKGSDANHLEQIYKQWYIADFYNGHAGWTLDRRTRALKFPPHFYNGSTTTLGSNGICDWMQDRLIYPDDENKYNSVGYYQGIADLQEKSPAPSAYRHGDNFFTLLRIAAPQIDNGSLSKWLKGNIIYDGGFIRNWYGKTLEEVMKTVGAATEADLRRNIRYELRAVHSVYDPMTGEVIDPQTGLPIGTVPPSE